MKLGSIFILAYNLAAVYSYTVVVCQGLDGATMGDVEWAVFNRRDDLRLVPKGFWNAGVVDDCFMNPNNTVSGYALCRSDPYPESQYTLLASNTMVICAESGWHDELSCPLSC
jgi:hypothetical protein